MMVTLDSGIPRIRETGHFIEALAGKQVVHLSANSCYYPSGSRTT
jgi:hypothetical protein